MAEAEQETSIELAIGHSHRDAPPLHAPISRQHHRRYAFAAETRSFRADSPNNALTIINGPEVIYNASCGDLHSY